MGKGRMGKRVGKLKFVSDQGVNYIYNFLISFSLIHSIFSTIYVYFSSIVFQCREIGNEMKEEHDQPPESFKMSAIVSVAE